MTNTEISLQFLQALYGGADHGYLTLFLLPGERTLWQEVTQLDAVRKVLPGVVPTHDVYFGLGLRAHRLARGRGEESSIVAIPGLWIDLDVADAVHKAKGLPPDTKAVLSLLEATIAMPPSIVVHTGHGLHAYWLFRELWYFETDAERSQARDLVHRLQMTVKAAGQAQGWTTDSTFDLARVFRVPGTMNRKGDVPVPVECLTWQPERRYNPQDFDDLLPAPAMLTPAPQARPGSLEMSALRISSRLKYLLRTGDDPEQPDRYASRSEAQFAVITALVQERYSDEQIVEIFATPDYALTQKAQERSPQWLRQDITRARDKAVTLPARQTSTPSEQREDVPPEVASLIESLRFPFVDTGPHIPPLPRHLQLLMPPGTTWLSDYAAHSAYWAPRAAPSYHQAVGLWVLSTVAARRIVVHMGSTEVYPTLFLALVSESTHWTKTTAASIGIRLLRRAGCGHLLAPDRTTPQFLLKLMAGIVPQDYGTRDEDGQRQAREMFGFAAQRGWFYEEWGGMLHQMRRVDSPHAELNKLLIVLEGGAESFETGTIQRGLERITAPYLALLGNATPHDLAPFMGEGNAWWHDGFWPRFACITPPYGEPPSRAPRPRETYQLPSDLIVRLHDWHVRLGSPAVTIAEEREANGKLTGAWVGRAGSLPCQTLTLAPDVYDAYEAYNDAILEIAHSGDVADDLSPWYGRAHEKALRVAMLLASVDNQRVITLPYWSEGQAMAETWRRNLHEVVATVGEKTPLSREAQLEAKIVSLCARTGGLTARELQRHTHAPSSDLLQKTLSSMVKIGAVTQVKIGRKTLYTILEEPEEGTEL